MSVQRLDGFGHVTLDHPLPYFVEATREHMTVINALSELRWMKLQDTIDSFVSFPHVCCPWGCCKFYNHVNNLPVNAVFALKIDVLRTDKTTICSNKDMHFLRGVRVDFLDYKEHPFGFEKFHCEPTIAFIAGHGPAVLCCRYHNKTCVKSYLHAPYNPTGNVVSTIMDQYAPAVLESRTVHSAQPHKYSNAFQMNEMAGHYEGIDSVTLCDRGNFEKRSILSDVRDSLTVAS